MLLQKVLARLETSANKDKAAWTSLRKKITGLVEKKKKAKTTTEKDKIADQLKTARAQLKRLMGPVSK